MLSTAPLLDTSLEGLTLARRGKVRDVYELTLPSGEAALLIVATDRISAFDYVLGSGIPDKGKVLTQLSGFWFERIGDLVPHHLISLDVDAFPEAARAARRRRCADGRCWRAGPSRCRSSAWRAGICPDPAGRNTSRAGSVCGVKLPAGLRESDRLPEPIFTPATKADTGHDVNISEDEAGRLVGRELIARLKTLTLEIYRRGAAHAESKGIIVADTKFEFGLVGAGNPATDVVLIDEVLTPDSSRFWPRDVVRAGTRPAELRQAVRPRLPRRDPLEQTAAGPVAARRRDSADAREVRRGVPSPVRPRAPVAVRDQLEKLVQEMLDKGRALRRRPARVREDVHRPRAPAVEGERRRRRRDARPAPQHRRPEDHGVPHQTNQLMREGLGAGAPR